LNGSNPDGRTLNIYISVYDVCVMEKTLDKVISIFENPMGEFLSGLFAGVYPVGTLVGAVSEAAKWDILTISYTLYSGSHPLNPFKLGGAYLGLAYIYENPGMGLAFGVAMGALNIAGNYTRRLD